MGHSIVCGMGQVGRSVVRLLRQLGQEVTVITPVAGAQRDDWLRAAEEMGVRVIPGDARDPRLLLQADVEGAGALLCLTNQDAVNIEIALDARRLRPDLPVVVRLFDQDLARSLEEAEAFGIRRALGVSTLAAPVFAAALLGRQVLATLVFPGPGAEGGRTYVVGRAERDDQGARADAVVLAEGPEGDLLLAQRQAWEEEDRDRRGPGGGGDGTGLEDPEERSLGQVLSAAWGNAPAVLRHLLVGLLGLIALSVLVFSAGMRLTPVDAFYFIIATVTTTGYGDISPRDAGTALKLYTCLLMLFGSAATASLYSLLTGYVVGERMARGDRPPRRDHVIVVGLGEVGYRVVNELQRHQLPLVAVTREPGGEFVATVRGTGPVLIGDGRLPETLLSAGIRSARAVIAATDDDATNISIALQARRLRRERPLPLVVRLIDADFAVKVQQGLGLKAALSAAEISAPAFAGASLCEGVLTAFVADGALFTLWEREAAAAWAGKTVAQVQAQTGARVVLRQAAGGGAGVAGPAAAAAVISRGDRLLLLSRSELGQVSPALP